MKHTQTYLITALVALVALPMGAHGQGTTTDPGADLWQDLVCVSALAGQSGSCYGSSAAGCSTASLQAAECRDDGGPKCRWYNAWEVDVETHPNEEAAAFADLFGAHNASSQDYWVEGEARCTGNDTGEGCTADQAEPACVSDLEDGSGKLECTHSLSVGFPSGVTYTVTCKDPANPYIAYRAVEKGQPFIWQKQIMRLDESGNELHGPFRN